MSDNHDKLNRQNRLIIIALIILALINGFFIILYISGQKKNERYLPVPGIAGLEGKKGDKGDKGDDGRTPIKGIDYFDGISPPPAAPGHTPVKGIDYFDGLSIKGADGYTPVKGVDYNDGKDGQQGPPGRTPEIRCNTDTQQFEQRYQGDESWTPMEGSDCVADK